MTGRTATSTRWRKELGYISIKPIKREDEGRILLNCLLSLGMLKIHIGNSETDKLVEEITNLVDTPAGKVKKSNVEDDLCDALRYTAMQIPWNTEAILKTVDLDARYHDAIKKKPPKRVRTTNELLDESRNAILFASREGARRTHDAVYEELEAAAAMLDD